MLVIIHGYQTATQMVEVIKTLLGYDCIHALDMPLEEKVEKVFGISNFASEGFVVE